MWPSGTPSLSSCLLRYSNEENKAKRAAIAHQGIEEGSVPRNDICSFPRSWVVRVGPMDTHLGCLLPTCWPCLAWSFLFGWCTPHSGASAAPEQRLSSGGKALREDRGTQDAPDSFSGKRVGMEDGDGGRGRRVEGDGGGGNVWLKQEFL